MLLLLAKAVGFPGATTGHEGDKKRSHPTLAKPLQAKPWQTDGLRCRRSSKASLAVFLTCLSQRRGNGGFEGALNRAFLKEGRAAAGS